MKRTRIKFPRHYLQYVGLSNTGFRPEIRDFLKRNRIKSYLFKYKCVVFFDNPGDAIRFKLQMPEWNEKFENPYTLQILKTSVQAKSRKLAAQWTFEIAEDLPPQFGLSIVNPHLNNKKAP